MEANIKKVGQLHEAHPSCTRGRKPTYSIPYIWQVISSLKKKKFANPSDGQYTLFNLDIPTISNVPNIVLRMYSKKFDGKPYLIQNKTIYFFNYNIFQTKIHALISS